VLLEAPAADDDQARTALRRMQEVGVGVLVPGASLEQVDVPNAVAVYDLAEWAAKGADAPLPGGAGRLALTVRGDESDEVLAQLPAFNPVMVLLDTHEHLSRLHAGKSEQVDEGAGNCGGALLLRSFSFLSFATP